MVHLLLAIIYISFVSLGLPDSLLGSAWPSMYGDLDVPVSYAGAISMIIAIGTVLSSLFSAKIIAKLGTGKVTALSVATTAIALFGFSFSHSFWLLCLWAIPYGVGAGSVDAALNNYVAVHYASRHMSWLHCMWGLGTIIGPYVIGAALTHGLSWNTGYRGIGIFQVVLASVLFLSLPLWKKNAAIQASKAKDHAPTKSLSLRETFSIVGVKEVAITFFCYCAVEQTAMLWASSYMVLNNGISIEAAASYASLFFIGITVGRGINGFLTYRFTDAQMVRIGESILILGILIMLLPFGNVVTLVGLVLLGLGCAPVYPCLIHATPNRFGTAHSQAIIGVQMASAYVGICIMPPIFGWIANTFSASLLPFYLLIILVCMAAMHERLIRKTMPRSKQETRA